MRLFSHIASCGAVRNQARLCSIIFVFFTRKMAKLRCTVVEPYRQMLLNVHFNLAFDAIIYLSC